MADTCPLCGGSVDEPCNVVRLDEHRASSTPRAPLPVGHTATVLSFRRAQEQHGQDAA